MCAFVCVFVCVCACVRACVLARACVLVHAWALLDCDDHRDTKFEGGFARDQGCKVQKIIYVNDVGNVTGFVCNVTGKPLSTWFAHTVVEFNLYLHCICICISVYRPLCRGHAIQITLPTVTDTSFGRITSRMDTFVEK